MLLKNVNIRSYKCILDSGEIGIEPNVTCFVGKNESGKTAFLESLYRLNPIPSGHRRSFKEMVDYPRHTRGTKPLSHTDFRPLVTTFTLEPKELHEFESSFGKGILHSPDITVSRNYGNELFVEFDLNELAFVQLMTSRSDLAQIRNSVKTFDQLVKKIGEFPMRSPELDKIYQNLQRFDLENQIRIRLINMLPQFYYFDEFSILPNSFSIHRVLNTEPDELSKEEYTARALLLSAGIEPNDILSGDYETQKMILEAAAREITQEVFKFWSQNSDLRVEFDISFPVDEKTGERKPFVDIRIWDEIHQISLKFNERSKGFIWFFSFLTNFSSLLVGDERVIILLDEPGLGLHPKAQQDLLRFITEKLAIKHQIVFTTHSPFMIDPVKLHRVRTVENQKKQGSKFYHEFAFSSPETLMPIRAALGHQLIQSSALGPNTILVEDTSDMIYLHAISKLLKSQDRTGLDESWAIIPRGSIKNIVMSTALGAKGENPIVLSNVKEAEKQVILELARQKLLDPNKLLLVTDFIAKAEADMEDLFDPEFFLALVRKSGAADLHPTQLPQGVRIIDRITKALGAPINKVLPALLLLQANNGLASNLSENTLARFEKMFEKINALKLAG